MIVRLRILLCTPSRAKANVPRSGTFRNTPARKSQSLTRLRATKMSFNKGMRCSLC